jgi:hypothetical protein
MLIVWRGFGISVLGIALGCLGGAQLLANRLSGTSTYWESHAWPFAAGLLSAAAIIWCVAEMLERYSTWNQINSLTGETVRLKKPHDFFYIPLKYWSALFVGLGLFSLFVNHVPGPSRARASDVAHVRPPR